MKDLRSKLSPIKLVHVIMQIRMKQVTGPRVRYEQKRQPLQAFSFYEGHLNLGLQTVLFSGVSLIDYQPSFPFYLQLYPEFL